MKTIRQEYQITRTSNLNNKALERTQVVLSWKPQR